MPGTTIASALISVSPRSRCWSRSSTVSRRKTSSSRRVLWGSYFGEVIRKRFAGEWELSQYPGGGVSAVPTLVVRGSRLYPLMKVYRRLTLGNGENLPAFYKMISGRLDDASKERSEGVL